MQLVIIFICLYDAETRLICQPSYRSMCELTSMQVPAGLVALATQL